MLLQKKRTHTKRRAQAQNNIKLMVKCEFYRVGGKGYEIKPVLLKLSLKVAIRL
jgi:hypothetical protein